MDAMGKIQQLHNFVQKQRRCESENLTLPLTGDKSEGLWYTAAITSQGGDTMHINWFRDENNLIYINGATQLAELEKTLRFPGLEEAANELRQHPTAEGFTIKGPKRTSGSDLWPAYRNGGKHFLLHGRDAGVLRHLLARRAGDPIARTFPLQLARGCATLSFDKFITGQRAGLVRDWRRNGVRCPARRSL